MIDKKVATLGLLLAICAFSHAYKVRSIRGRNASITPFEGGNFTIDYDNDTFLLDGEPFRYVSGSFHYFRAPPAKWRTIMSNMKAGGLNAVDIYVHWALHNPRDKEYNWEGIADIVDVIEAAIDNELYVILRPGPYVCAEIDNGGLPYWLYTKYPGIKVRTKDVYFLNEVKHWYEQLMSQLEDYMYGNGGPIILVQVENEYGAYKKCDPVYKKFLASETRRYTKDNAVLFTVDRPFDGELECGLIEGVFATTDFGLQTDEEVDAYWAELRKVQPRGPLVNSEFYTGWLTHWHEQNQRRPAGPLATTLLKMLTDGANVNFYMYFGGTNFGFSAGANDWGVGKYMADITSYDYDAPLDEAGNPTEKFDMFKKVIQGVFPEARIPETPELRSVFPLGAVALKMKAKILSEDVLATLDVRTEEFERPVTFEKFNQDTGFLIYETVLPEFTRDPSQLVINGLHDRAWVFVNGLLVGTLSRENNINSLPVSAGWGNKLTIIVENQGRINFQSEGDFKGILGDVLIQAYDVPYITLVNWKVTGLPFDNYSAIEQIAFDEERQERPDDLGILLSGPAIFSGEFDFPFEEAPTPLPDLYLDTSGWGKGIIFVNGWNLGRYWPLAGPQQTTYIPGEILEPKGNRLVLVEFQKFNKDDLKVSFVPEAKLDG